MGHEEYEAWARAAASDWQAARLMAGAGQYALAVFHFQQSAEKRLKALCALSGKPSFTHSLVELFRRLRDELGYEVEERLFNVARRLDVHYTQSRYPGSLGVAPEDLYDAEIAMEAEQWAEEIIEYAESFRSTKKA